MSDATHITEEQADLLHQEGRELAQTVEGHIRAGQPERAHRAFSRGWRDAVPELPLRFEVVLSRVDEKVARAVHKKLLKDQPLEMVLHRSSESVVEVRTSKRGKRLGNLPTQDARILHDLGADANLYRPQILEIRYDERGRLSSVAVMLVRPEVSYCSACGTKHDGPNVNCDSCRSKRRPTGEQRFEPSPVNYHEALDALVQEADGSEDDIPPFGD